MIETLASLALRGGYDMLAPIEKRRGGSLAEAGPGTQLYESLTLGVPTYTGRSINPNTAQTYTAVASCIKIIAEALASFDLITYRHSGDWRTKTPAIDDYRFRLLREQPNPEMSSYQWREFVAASLLAWGNSYNVLDIDNRGRVRAIWPIRPEWVMVMRNARGALEYHYRPLYPFAVPVAAGVYQDWQVLHIPGLGYDGIVGYSPITMARQAVALGLAAEEYAGRFFANNARPNVYLKTATAVKDPEQLRKAWHEAYGGLENTGKVAVLPLGMEVGTFSINPRDAQFLEGRAFQIGEIARIYKVPPFLLGDPSGKTATYASAEQSDLMFAKHTLLPWCKRIEQKLNITVLGSQDALSCKHDMSELLRGDSSAQASATATYVNAGIIDRDEARARIDMNPRGGNAAKLMVQSQNVPIDQAGAQQGESQS